MTIKSSQTLVAEALKEINTIVVAPVPILLEVNRLKFCAIFLLYKAMLIAIANPAETSPSAPALPVAPVSPRGIPSVKTPVLLS